MTQSPLHARASGTPAEVALPLACLAMDGHGDPASAAAAKKIECMGGKLLPWPDAEAHGFVPSGSRTT